MDGGRAFLEWRFWVGLGWEDGKVLCFCLMFVSKRNKQAL